MTDEFATRSMFDHVATLKAESTMRAARANQLGLDKEQDAQMDDLAMRLAFSFRELTNSDTPPLTMANVFGPGNGQNFPGLYVSDPPPETLIKVGRTMGYDHGWCPHVVTKKLALVLGDVHDYPRFHGNPVVDKVGIRCYVGAPVKDVDGVVLGTVCAIDVEAHNLSTPQGAPVNPALKLIKSYAAEMEAIIRERRR